MFCILVTGIPASGKSTMAEFLGERLCLPVFSKDSIKEIFFDRIGFSSRGEKVKLGEAALDVLYYAAEQTMKAKRAFILENNFENNSREGLMRLLNKYHYTAVTVMMTGEYDSIYRRFIERNMSPKRHRGHVVNDCYPERKRGENRGNDGNTIPAVTLSFDDFTGGIQERGMDIFVGNGPCIRVDTTYFEKVDQEEILCKVQAYLRGKDHEML